MPRGDKSAYTDKQKRKAEHIEEGYENRGVPEKEAERRAWATVNKESGGARNPVPAEVMRKTMPPQKRVVALVERFRQSGRPRSAPLQQRRPRQHANVMNTMPTIETCRR